MFTGRQNGREFPDPHILWRAKTRDRSLLPNFFADQQAIVKYFEDLDTYRTWADDMRNLEFKNLYRHSICFLLL